MPWEKRFDIDVAIDRATEVFMAKGYEAASLNDLMKAMGIQKGSFYNTFGSKKALFTKALLKYDLEQRKQGLIALESLNSPINAISQLFDGLIEQSIADKDKKGCLLVNTALDLPNRDSDTERTVKDGLKDFQVFFVKQIELGQSTGSIPLEKDAQAIAKALLTLVVGLRVLARGVFDQDGFESIKDQALNLLR